MAVASVGSQRVVDKVVAPHTELAPTKIVPLVLNGWARFSLGWVFDG